MKNIKKFILVIQLIFVGLLLLFNISCDKKNYTIPELTTTEVTEIGQVTALSGGNITNGGGADLIAKGVCWSTSPGPTLDDDATSDGKGAGSFTSEMTNLTFGTLYYVRAFAINAEKGLAYGNELSFTTAQPAGVDCPADLWTGDLDCKDLVWTDYKPTYCTGVKMGDCNLLNVTFDFWGYGSSSEVVFQLQLEPIDLTTYTGEVSLLSDATCNAEGYDITFHAGAAGTYEALTGKLLIDVEMTGYADGPYQFEITKVE